MSAPAHQVWVVTHGKVVAPADLQLACRRKQLFPARLKPQRIVELTEDGQQWPIGQTPPQRGVDVGIEGMGTARIAEVGMPRPAGRRIDSRPKSRAVCAAPVPTGPEPRRRRAGKRIDGRVQFTHGGAAHRREHAPEQRTRGPPCEAVDRGQCRDAVAATGGGQEAGRAAQVVGYQGEVT